MTNTNPMKTGAAQTVAASPFAAAGPSRRRQSVSPSQITLADEFNGRSTMLNREHIRELAQAYRNSGKLDPVLLWAEVQGEKLTGRLLLLDGKHRLAAYHTVRKSPEGRKRTVPAVILTGTREEAMKAAAAANANARLPWTLAERTNFAWRMVRALWAEFSRVDIAKATAISEATVSRMRRRWRVIAPSPTPPSGHWCIDREDRQDDRKLAAPPTPAEIQRQVETLKALLKTAQKGFVAATGGKPSAMIMGEAMKGIMGTVRFKNMYAGAMLIEEDEFSQDPDRAPVEATTGTLEEACGSDF